MVPSCVFFAFFEWTKGRDLQFSFFRDKAYYRAGRIHEVYQHQSKKKKTQSHPEAAANRISLPEGVKVTGLPAEPSCVIPLPMAWDVKERLGAENYNLRRKGNDYPEVCVIECDFFEDDSTFVTGKLEAEKTTRGFLPEKTQLPPPSVGTTSRWGLAEAHHSSFLIPESAMA